MLSRNESEFWENHRRVWENYRNMPDEERRIHDLSYQVDPTYLRLPLRLMAEASPLLAAGVPLVAIGRAMTGLYVSYKARKEVPIAIADGFPTNFYEAVRFMQTTRWPNEGYKKCNVLELMISQPERISSFAAWKVSKIEITPRTEELVKAVLDLYQERQRRFIGYRRVAV